MHNYRIRTNDIVHTVCMSNHFTASVKTLVLILPMTLIILKCFCITGLCHLVPGSRTSGAGPAAPPAPAMTSESPARDSTWISAMCRRTETRLRNKPPLDNWPVEVRSWSWSALAHTTESEACVSETPSPSPLAIGGPACPRLPPAAAMTATEIRVLGVGRSWPGPPVGPAGGHPPAARVICSRLNQAVALPGRSSQNSESQWRRMIWVTDESRESWEQSPCRRPVGLQWARPWISGCEGALANT